MYDLKAIKSIPASEETFKCFQVYPATSIVITQGNDEQGDLLSAQALIACVRSREAKLAW